VRMGAPFDHLSAVARAAKRRGLTRCLSWRISGARLEQVAVQLTVYTWLTFIRLGIHRSPRKKGFAVDSCLVALELVARAKEDIRQSIKNPGIVWLLITSACDRCASFLTAYYAEDVRSCDERSQRYEAGRLLLILAAMEGGSECDTLEALRVMGTRSVDTQGQKPKKRYRLAGEARERPVTDYRHYKRYGHLARMEQRVATELHALVARPDRLELALETNGSTAVAKYL